MCSCRREACQGHDEPLQIHSRGRATVPCLKLPIAPAVLSPASGRRACTHLRPFLEAVKCHTALRQHLAADEPGLAASDDAHALLALC